jgi:pyruvate/2-oxoglutarate/acetoin dehydrogenase E1 component
MATKEKFQMDTIPIGVADIKREGTDVTIVSFGKIIKKHI